MDDFLLTVGVAFARPLQEVGESARGVVHERPPVCRKGGASMRGHRNDAAKMVFGEVGVTGIGTGTLKRVRSNPLPGGPSASDDVQRFAGAR
jgi:hypothetical protein